MGGLVTLTFDLETGMRAASDESHQRWVLGNPRSKFGHAGPLGSRIIRYVRDGRTDRQTEGQKQRVLPPFLRAGA